MDSSHQSLTNCRLPCVRLNGGVKREIKRSFKRHENGSRGGHESVAFKTRKITRIDLLELPRGAISESPCELKQKPFRSFITDETIVSRNLPQTSFQFLHSAVTHNSSAPNNCSPRRIACEKNVFLFLRLTKTEKKILRLSKTKAKEYEK